MVNVGGSTYVKPGTPSPNDPVQSLTWFYREGPDMAIIPAVLVDELCHDTQQNLGSAINMYR